jgi:hypothetical protein
MRPGGSTDFAGVHRFLWRDFYIGSPVSMEGAGNAKSPSRKQEGQQYAQSQDDLHPVEAN